MKFAAAPAHPQHEIPGKLHRKCLELVSMCLSRRNSHEAYPTLELAYRSQKMTKSFNKSCAMVASQDIGTTSLYA